MHPAQNATVVTLVTPLILICEVAIGTVDISQLKQLLSEI